MARNNDVFNVLVSNIEEPLLEAGAEVTGLKVGQYGFFDSDTNLSFDPTVTKPKNFYIALGLDKDGDTVLDDINKSAGQHIQFKNVQKVRYSPYKAGTNMIVKVSDYNAKCDTDYGIRIEMQNEEILQMIGNVQFSKSFVVRTSCCEDTCECPSGDANEITKLFVQAMEDETLFTVVAKATQALTVQTHGVSKGYLKDATIDVLEDLDAMIAYNSDPDNAETKVWSYLEIESTPQSIKAFYGINTDYQKLRGTKLIVSLVEGMECNGKALTTQSLTFEQGLGYNINVLEYQAFGWTGETGPYRTNGINGLAKPMNYVAIPATHYDMFTIEYEFEAQSGWGEYRNDLATIIAVPTGSSVVDSIGEALIGLFDSIDGEELLP